MKTLNRRQFIKSAAALSATSIATTHADTFTQISPSTVFKHESVMNLIVPQIATVRIGFIGVGTRGLSHVKHCCHIDGIEIKAICDTDQNAIDQACHYVEQQHIMRPDEYTGSDLAYKDMLNRNDIDIVIISTPWRWHTPMAVDSMNSGKHAFVEVPAATSVDECWLLVDTAERTQKNCMMMENVCYGQDELMMLNMVRQGLFGEILHGEAAYIHDFRGQMKQEAKNSGSWRTYWHTKKNGNLYPTHGLGPISQYMNINRGDQFDFLTSTSSSTAKQKTYAERENKKPHPQHQLQYATTDTNTTVINTKRGRTITVQHDTTLKKPYLHSTLIQGTNGEFSGSTNRITLEKLPDIVKHSYRNAHQLAVKKWQENGQIGKKPEIASQHQRAHNLNHWRKHYQHPLWQRMEAEASQNGGHSNMDFLMLWRMVYCLRNGQALDQNVYDAAAWSVIAPLSADSLTDRSNSKDIPDFTRGLWKNTAPLSIVS